MRRAPDTGESTASIVARSNDAAWLRALPLLRAGAKLNLADGWTEVDALCDAIERAQPWRHVDRSYARKIASAWRRDQAAAAMEEPQ